MQHAIHAVMTCPLPYQSRKKVHLIENPAEFKISSQKYDESRHKLGFINILLPNHASRI